MRLRIWKATLVFRKDWREISRNWQVILPIVVIPLMFSVLLPVLLVLIPNMANLPGTSLGGLETMI